MDRPAAFDAFFVQLLKLFSSDSTGGASTLASAAVDASVCVHRSNTINGDSANRASALASAAANTCVRNLVCHNKLSFLSPCPKYCMKSHVWHGCACLSGNHILACILTKQVRKGKTNRDPKNTKVCFLLGCTKAQANLWPNLQEFFGKNHEEQLVLADYPLRAAGAALTPFRQRASGRSRRPHSAFRHRRRKPPPGPGCARRSNRRPGPGGGAHACRR